jgi:protein gp37
MGADSKIEWTNHTFNPWVGCAKVSPACTSCYAEGWAKRTGQAGLWRGERRRTSVANWREPLKWQRQAAAQHRDTGVEPVTRVFCASLADVFESHAEIDDRWRSNLWELIEETTYLTWLLLTKRPQNVRGMVPAHWLDGQWPARVWLGTTVEHQDSADERIPYLLRCPAVVRFLSCEPLLGPVDLRLDNYGPYDGRASTLRGTALHWIIGGGESGSGARPTHPDWFRSLRNQCGAAGIAFFFKQWGEWREATRDDLDAHTPGKSMAIDPTGRRKELTEAFVPPADALMVRVGKKAAGRLLDGAEHSAFPKAMP